MRRKPTSASSLDNLKLEAKRWLKAIRAGDSDALARFRRTLPQGPADPGLRDIQHALARERGFAGWAALKAKQSAGSPSPSEAARADALGRLLAAAERGDAASVAAELDGHPDLVSERGLVPGHTGLRTALHFAVTRPHEDIVRLLLDRGADPNVRDDGDNAIPLHFVAEKEHLPMIQLLIERGSDPIGAGDYHELEVIGWATCFGTGRKDVADYLLAHGARHNIFSAVAMGETETIRQLAAAAELLDRRMDRANNGRRALHLAVVKHRPESLATLLELGADPEATDDSGLTPLDQAALAGEAAMTKLLIDRGARINLPAAVGLSRTDDIERLLQQEPNSLAPGGRWATLIVRAAERSTGRVIETLIRAGASAQAVDDTRTSVDSSRGYTALHAAAFFGNSATVAALMKHGADVRARDGRYGGTPAGWANYRGHTEVRDFILAGPIDLFEAITFGLTHRIGAILDREPGALDRRFGSYVPNVERSWPDPSLTPLLWASANGNTDAARILLGRGADAALRDGAGRDVLDLAKDGAREAIAAALAERSAGSAPVRPVDSASDRVAPFLLGACLDWRVGGSQRAARMHDAARILRNHPEIALDSIYTAVACGDLELVRRILGEDPELASQSGGPRQWPPLLYLCTARLPFPAASDHAVAIATALLDGGADPNAFYFGGQSSIHYSALTCVLGRGEEQGAMHPQAEPLARLLLDRGAEPYDVQVLYNVFADHASRKNLGDDIVWLLELMHGCSIRLGRGSDWSDPTWSMLDMGGYGRGARYLLGAAVDSNSPGLAQWMLAHGAGPNAAPSADPRQSQESLYRRARRRGFMAMADLLVRFGATQDPPILDEHDRYVDAVFRLDREAARDLAAKHPEYLTDTRALFQAAELNRTDAAELLLDLGVSPDIGAPGEGGRRALHVAGYVGAADVAQLLIARGADVDFRETNYHAIPLGVASWAQQPELIELLGRFSRDLWELVYTGRVERVRELLRSNPELAQIRNAEGETPLMWLPNDDDAALAIAQLLIAHGADLTAHDGRGRTAADIARERGMDEVSRTLTPVDG